MSAGVFDTYSKLLPPSCEEALRQWENYFQDLADFSVQEWEGYHLLPGCNAVALDWVYKNFTPKPTDVVTVSGFKTGTTLVREIIRQLLYGEDPKLEKLTRGIDYYLCYFEFGQISKWEIWDALNLPRRYFQTHLPPDALNMEKFKKCKLVHCQRNFKDQLTSCYHFCKSVPAFCLTNPDKYPPEWDEFLKQHLTGRMPLELKQGEDFLDYNKHWKPYQNWDNILTVMFEDMVENLPREIRRIAKHIEVDVTPEDVKRVADACSLDTMKKNNFGPLIRKGIVGDWKNRFTDAQSDRVDKLMQERGLGLVK